MLRAKWVKPEIEYEMGEVRRIVEDRRKEDPEKFDRFKTQGEAEKGMVEAFSRGELIQVNHNFMKHLYNTDYNEINKLEDAKKLAKEYNRDIGRIIGGFIYHKEMPAPIVVDWIKYVDLNVGARNIGVDYVGKNRRWKNRPELVGGNTRIMVAKGMGIPITIWYFVI